MFGKTLVANDAETQRILHAALEAAAQGKQTNGVQLELRRKDNGNPVWVQWWTRPAADGKSTRTMILDITDRVLMEREQARLQAQNAYLMEEIRSAHNFGDLIGVSPGLRKVMQQIQLLRPPTPQCWSPAKAARARNWLREPSENSSAQKGARSSL